MLHILKKQILAIDDDPKTRYIYRHKLANENCKLTLAADGLEGVQLFKKLHPDLVILDMLLPKKSGLEVLEDLTNLQICSAKILIVSNYEQLAFQQKLSCFKYDGYLTKCCVSLEKLVTIIWSMLSVQKNISSST